MDFQNYVDEKKMFYGIFMSYIESQSEASDEYQTLINYLETKELGGSRDELEDVLHLILKLSKNHFRHPTFWSKIEAILIFLENDIKQTFTNSELFEFFKLS